MSATRVATRDLYRAYLTSPFTSAKWRDSSLTFEVNGLLYDDFVDLVEELGWELVESRELAEETHGGWADVTIRRKK